MKRNLLKIPPTILERIRTFDQDDVLAATVKSIRPEEVSSYAKLGISLTGDTLNTPPPAPPDPRAGRYSSANLFGWDKVRKDLPKITKEFGFWAPSWGSGSYHYVSHEREVYQRDFFPPKEVDLSVEMVERRGETFLVKFAIDQVINRRTSNFEQELLYNLNLLQESVGAVGVFESATSLAEYAATVQVDWQLLPPGSADEVLEGILRGKKPVSAEQRAVMRERIAVMTKLNPEAFVAGTDGFLRYFGAKFGDDFVAFENVQYGNALYIMYDDWQALSQKSRVDLLAGDSDTFDRIIHKDGWADQLKARVYEYRKRRRRQERLV